MGLDNLLEIFAPLQIMVVLLIALIVFGPKRLPELGRQLGQALRELNKAKNEFSRNLNLDYEPDPEPYRYADTTEPAYSYNPPEPPPLDLTDYTIAGAATVTPAADTVSHQDYTLAETHSLSQGATGLPDKPAGPYTAPETAAALTDSTYAVMAETAQAATVSSGSGVAVEPTKEGEHHV